VGFVIPQVDKILFLVIVDFTGNEHVDIGSKILSFSGLGAYEQ
jgi:hypothetical protein